MNIVADIRQPLVDQYPREGEVLGKGVQAKAKEFVGMRVKVCAQA